MKRDKEGYSFPLLLWILDYGAPAHDETGDRE